MASWCQPSCWLRYRNLTQEDWAEAELRSCRKASRSSGCTAEITLERDAMGSGKAAARAGAPPSHSSWCAWGEYSHRPRSAAVVAIRNGISRLARSFRASSACTQTSCSSPAGSFTDRASIKQATDAPPRPGNSSTRIATDFVLAAWTTRLSAEIRWLAGHRSPKSCPRHCSAGLPSTVAIAALRPLMTPSSVKRAAGSAL
jgi:hypothetical protein